MHVVCMVQPGESIADFEARRRRRKSQLLLHTALGRPLDGSPCSERDAGEVSKSPDDGDGNEHARPLETLNSQTLLNLPDDDERFEDYLWGLGPHKRGTINPRSKVVPHAMRSYPNPNADAPFACLPHFSPTLPSGGAPGSG
jgi:hypothetical protein